MAPANKRHLSEPIPPDGLLASMMQQSQLDFEIEFFAAVLNHSPDYVELLRSQAKNLATKGLHAESMRIDERWVQLRPDDPLAYYHLACTHALLKQADQAITNLRKAVEHGYRDFRHLREDRDFDSIRKDPRFRALLREYENQ